MPKQDEKVQGNSTVEPFIASTDDTFPVVTSSPRTCSTSESKTGSRAHRIDVSES